MSDMEPWTRQLLSVIVSQLCKTIGWHSISTTCLQILVDVLHRYLKQLGTSVHDYSEHYNHTLPALEELSLALNDMGISVDDLKEYVDYVAPIAIKEKVPKYPLEKKSNLNFLKPGSREVVTRPVHIHEHLPAMHPEMSEDYSVAAPSHHTFNIENSSSLPNQSNVVSSSSGSNTLKKAGDMDMPMANKHVQRLISEEIGRPLRELSCVTMTTSGFLSPAKEGKAPEARIPKALSNYSLNVNSSSNNNSSSSNNTSINNVPANQLLAPVHSEMKTEKSEHKKHSHSKSKSSDHRKNREDLHHNGHKIADDSKAKKHASAKELSKLKAFKASHRKSNENHEFSARPSKPEKVKMSAPSVSPVEPKVVPPKVRPEKVEKVPPPAPSVEKFEMPVEKLPTEPNKSKLNIFKRFTKPKEDRVDSSTVPPAKNHPPDKNAQINECIEAVVKRGRVKDDPNMRSISRASIEPQPVPSISAEPKLETQPSGAAVSSSKDMKRKKKPKTHDLGPSAKRPKVNHETLPPSPPTAPVNVKTAPKQPTEPEPPPFSFFTQLQTTPGLMPPSLSSNLLIPRFTPFMNFSKMGDPNGPHPEMPNLPLPPATLMQPPAAELHQKIVPPAPAPAPSKKSVPDEDKVENSAAPALSDKKLKKKLKKDKKEKEKKKREKKERLKKERLEKKDLKKLKSKKEKLKKKQKLATAAAAPKEASHQPAEDPSVPKIKLKLNSGNSPQLSPSAGTSGIQSPKIVIKPVLKPAEETLNAAASGSVVDKQHHRDGRESSPELAKIAYIGRPQKQKSSSKNSSTDMAVANASGAVAQVNNHIKPEPIAPITLLKSGGSEKNLKIKTKPKEKTKGKKNKVPAVAAKPKPTGFYYDADGKQVWVCPACGGQDDGTPMIGCDGGCDAWYHWECVGIKSPPTAANWYCKSCVSS